MNRVEPTAILRRQFDMEPAWAGLVERRRVAQALPPYQLASVADVTVGLERMLVAEGWQGRIGSVSRLGGGASKEQFLFDWHHSAEAGGGEKSCRYVLRTDPKSPIIETDCRREFAALTVMQGRVPVPEPVLLDHAGAYFNRPAMITRFVSGVTKPSVSQDRVSGLGTRLGEPLRSRMKHQFMTYLVAIHAYDWRSLPVPGFDVPDSDPYQAARWSIGFWDAIWRLDKIEERPVVTIAWRWLEKNLSACRDLVFTHGDYRTGNYLFDEGRAEITAVLDWELARIGDYHEDLAWILMRLFGVYEGGKFFAVDLYEREECIVAYEEASGRVVNRATLRFYDILGVLKTYIVVAASGLSVARRKHSHQDVMLTYMGATTPMFASELTRLLLEEL
jgi:hypothetical protein